MSGKEASILIKMKQERLTQEQTSIVASVSQKLPGIIMSTQTLHTSFLVRVYAGLIVFLKLVMNMEQVLG